MIPNHFYRLINLDLIGTGEKGATVVNATIHEKEFELLKKINTENLNLTLQNIIYPLATN